MKKNAPRKLALNRESLRLLVGPELEPVDGAGGFSKGVTFCATCVNTCQYTCTL